MVIFQIDMPNLYCQIIIKSIIAVALLAVIVYFNFIFIKPGELHGWFLMYKIVPTVVLALGIIYFFSSSVTAIQAVSSINDGKYFTVQGEIEDLTAEEFWLNGSDVPNYDCSFIVDGIEFPFSNYYTQEEANTLKNANENEDIVKVSYLLDPKSKYPIPIKIEIVES